MKVHGQDIGGDGIVHFQGGEIKTIVQEMWPLHLKYSEPSSVLSIEDSLEMSTFHIQLTQV